MEGEANYQTPTNGAHVLLVTFPTQGHINPMLQFSKRLASKGVKVTLITTSSISLELSSKTTNSSNLEVLTIFDGFKKGETTDDVAAYVARLKASISQSFLELLDHYQQNKTKLQPTPKMVIYDSVMPWVLDVAKNCGLEAASFFTQSCVVSAMYYHVYEGALKIPTNGSLVSLPSIKELFSVDELPSFLSTPSLYPAFGKLMFDQFSNFKEADCLFFNTVDKLETEVVDWMASAKWPVKTIGPTLPSMYLDKRLQDDTDYGLNMFKPETDACIRWLDAKQSDSVVYISMGSWATLGEEQMEEMAMALEKCNQYFLWIVRASEEHKLPLNFKEKTSEKGLVLSWCPQLEVLAHPSLGCFVTHCGWNSTLEAISLGIPMVTIPQWTDQLTNAKCITDFWRTGVRVKVNEKGIATKDKIECCIREVMEGESAKENKSNATKWKELAKEAMEKGGSSDKNIEDFVTKLLSS